MFHILSTVCCPVPWYLLPDNYSKKLIELIHKVFKLKHTTLIIKANLAALSGI